MRKLGYDIMHLIQLIRFFGVKDGFKIFLAIAFNSLLVRVSSIKFKNTIEIRKKDSDLPIFYQVFAELQYDINYFLKYTPKTIVDCGANVGFACLYFSSLFPGAEIIAVEPQKDNYNQLCKNVKSYSNIKPLHAAIWHKPGKLVIKNESEMSASFEVQENTEANIAGLNAVTIDEIIRDNNFDQIDILKIDIEGSEYNLFANNPHTWLSKTRCLVIELHDNLKPGTSQLFFKEMAKYDWQTVIKGENIVCFKA
ncbi:MAG TPA: FkbM family methyltransferase [Chitinophagaceae bacterium]|nr:FkbM family methyltransferase [Chitinophagaceae bacterium]